MYPSLIGPLLPRPEPAGLLRFVIHRDHHQHDLPHNQSQPDHRHRPSIHIEAVIKAEGCYIEYMSALLHNQVT